MSVHTRGYSTGKPACQGNNCGLRTSPLIDGLCRWCYQIGNPKRTDSK